MRMFEVNKDENTIFFTMVYSNPPTYGYRVVFDRLKEMAGDSDHVVFVSPAQDKLLNPLPHEKAIDYNMRIFTDIRFYKKPNIHNSLEAIKYLSQKYSTIYMVTEDDKVRKFERYYSYAEDWGIFEFDILGLGIIDENVPDTKTNRMARQAVIDNNFELFKESVPTNDINLVSKLFIDLRKIMTSTVKDRTKKDNETKETEESDNESDNKENEKEDNEKNESIKQTVDSLIEFTRNKNKNFSILNEYLRTDKGGNKYIRLSEISENFHNMKLVLSDKTQDFNIGKDRLDDSYAIFVNSSVKCLDKKLEENRKQLQNALKRVSLMETTTAGSIANVNMGFGQPIKRRNENLSYVKEIKNDNNVHNKFQTAMKQHIDKYGYIDSNAINEIKRILGIE